MSFLPESLDFNLNLNRNQIFADIRRYSCLYVGGLFAISLMVGTVNAQTDGSSKSSPTQKEVKDSEENQGEKEESKAENFDLKENLASFDQVWKTIDDSHWDEEVVGQTWDDARAKYRPMVEDARSINEVREVLENMIAELGQSHFGIIPSSSYEVVGDTGGGGEGDCGLTFRATEEGVLVSEVRPDSSASRAGVKQGWMLETVKDKAVQEISDKVREAAHGPTRYETLIGLAMSKVTQGAVGSKSRFVFRDGENQSREMELDLETAPGKSVKLGHLPAVRVATKSETLDGNIGYYRFSAFLDPVTVMKEFRESVHAKEHHGGVIIDLRGNIGGLAAMTMGMASEFSNKQTTLGVMTMKGSELKFFVNANLDHVTAPVAVLIDECSISSAEIFSGGLQDLKLARLFGTRTAGLALPSVVVKLPNGDGFQYAMANYHSASGKSLEMDGVTPDEVIPLSRELLLRNPDPVKSRAIEWIKQQAKNK